MLSTSNILNELSDKTKIDGKKKKDDKLTLGDKARVAGALTLGAGVVGGLAYGKVLLNRKIRDSARNLARYARNSENH